MAKTVSFTDLGTLSPQIWPGNISRSAMVADGFTSNEAIEAAIAVLPQYYIPVTPGAPTRCIDGRPNPIADDMVLGPQVPAGTPGAALAYHLAAVDDIAESYVLDAQAIVNRLRAAGITPGGHRDEHSRHTDKVGCGAIDGMDRALVTMLDERFKEEHVRLTQAVLGSAFDQGTYDEIIRSVATLLGPDSSFFNGREAIIDHIESEYPGSVGVLTGEHHECIVVLNTVADTTFMTDTFVTDMRGIQAFGYDVWRTPIVAEILFPGDAHDDLRNQFITARVMVAVATLMILTDGSQRLLVRATE